MIIDQVTAELFKSLKSYVNHSMPIFIIFISIIRFLDYMYYKEFDYNNCYKNSRNDWRDIYFYSVMLSIGTHMDTFIISHISYFRIFLILLALILPYFLVDFLVETIVSYSLKSIYVTNLLNVFYEYLMKIPPLTKSFYLYIKSFFVKKEMKVKRRRRTKTELIEAREKRIHDLEKEVRNNLNKEEDNEDLLEKKLTNLIKKRWIDKKESINTPTEYFIIDPITQKITEPTQQNIHFKDNEILDNINDNTCSSIDGMHNDNINDNHNPNNDNVDLSNNNVEDHNVVTKSDISVDIGEATTDEPIH